MTSRARSDLDRAITGAPDYLAHSSTKATDYVTHTIGPALSAAIDDLKLDLLPHHDVDVATLGSVVHYTSLRALFAMIRDVAPRPPITKRDPRDERPTDCRFLRLYDSANLNDPSEGGYFLKQLDTYYDVVKVPAYIASFVTPNDATDPANDLVFWRHYGNDGRGCSISIPSQRFPSTPSTFRLRTISYGHMKAEDDAQKLRPIIRRLDPVVQHARDRSAHNPTGDTTLYRLLAVTILESLGELPYLYKSTAYQYEHECRVVALQSDFEKADDIRHTFDQRLDGVGRPRMYGLHPCLNMTNLLSTGTVITLGPAVPNRDNVQYALEQLLASVGIRGLPINLSRIPYRGAT